MFIYVSSLERSEDINVKVLKYIDNNKVKIHKHFGVPIYAKVVNSGNLDEVKMMGIEALPALYNNKKIIDGCDEIIEYLEGEIRQDEERPQHQERRRVQLEEPDLKEAMLKSAGDHNEKDEDDSEVTTSDLNSKYNEALKSRKLSTGQPVQTSSKLQPQPAKQEEHEAPPKQPKAPIVPEDNDDKLMLDKFYSDI
jgi:hypothetical protein